ncbi:MAG: EAL domain-containing protein [Microthrixaceae bacterium]
MWSRRWESTSPRRQFRDPDFLGIIESALSETGLAPDRLIVEITESIFISDIEMASQKLRDLRQMGTFLALDDFGTGYASLSYLRTLPFHLLKIDKSFVENAPTRARDLSLLQTINRLGHDLGLQNSRRGRGDRSAGHARSVTAL